MRFISDTQSNQGLIELQFPSDLSLFSVHELVDNRFRRRDTDTRPPINHFVSARRKRRVIEKHDFSSLASQRDANEPLPLFSPARRNSWRQVDRSASGVSKTPIQGRKPTWRYRCPDNTAR